MLCVYVYVCVLVQQSVLWYLIKQQRPWQKLFAQNISKCHAAWIYDTLVCNSLELIKAEGGKGTGEWGMG